MIFCEELRLTNVILESDAKSVTEELRAMEESLSIYGQLIQEIQEAICSKITWKL